MADDNIITVKIELNPGSSLQDADNIGKRIGEAIKNAIKPDIDIGKSIQARPDAVKASAKVISDAFSDQIKAGISSAIGEAFSNVDFNKTDFGKNLSDVIRRTVSSHAAARPREEREEPAFDLTKRIQPFLSGVETLSLLMRGAPISSIAQMAGQTFRDFNELRRERERAREIFPAGMGGGGGGPRTPSVISGRTTEAMSAAESGAAGAAGFSLIRMLGIGGATVAGLGAAGLAVYKLSEETVGLAKRGADTTISWAGLARTMGQTREQFADMTVDFAKSGLSIDDSHRALNRLALTARREMPEITKKIEDYGNVSEEADIKVRDADRGVIKSHLDRQAAVEHVHEAEGELAKVQTTGADVRAQQFQAAALSVIGAQLGARRAAVQAEFAPEDRRIADARGLLGVAGARLGVEGADLSIESAQARLTQVLTGQREDPDVARARAIQQAQHGLEVAQLGAKQARLHAEETKEAEAKRRELPGPEEEAAHAKEQADLRVQQATTAQQTLAIHQEHNTLLDEENKRMRGVAEAQLAVEGGPDRDAEARIAQERALRQRERIKYEQAVPVQAQLERLARGEPLAEGYQFGRVSQQALREALISGGGGTGGGAFDFTRQVVQGLGKAGLEDQQQKVVEAIIREARGGGAQAENLLRVFRTPAGAYTPEQRELKERVVSAISPEEEAKAKGVQEKIGVSDLAQFLTKLETAQQVGTKSLDSAIKVVDGVSTAMGAVTRGAESAAEGLLKVGAAATNLLLPKTSPPSPEGTTPGTINADEATKKAGGGPTGLLHGPGTGTSDSIPINASAGEYVIKASRVQELGVPFLDRLNTDGVSMVDGGSVEEARKRRENYLKLRARMLRVSPEYAKAYIEKLQSGAKPMTAVTRENLFFGKTLEEQAAMRPKGIGIKDNPFFGKTPEEQAKILPTGFTGVPLPREKPVEEPVAMREHEPAAPVAAHTTADNKSWLDRTWFELATMARGDTATRTGEDRRGGLRQSQKAAIGATEDRPAPVPSAATRFLETPAPAPKFGFAPTPRETFENVKEFLGKPSSMPPSEWPKPESPSLIGAVSQEPQPKYDTGSEETQQNYQSGGVVGAGLIDEKELRKIGMTKNKYSTAVDNPATKAYAKSWFDSFANLGRLMTGKSEDIPMDVLKVATDFLGSGFGVRKSLEEVVKAGSGEAIRFAPHLLEKLVPEKESKPDARDLGVKPEMLLTKLPDEEESHAAGGLVGMQGGGPVGPIAPGTEAAIMAGFGSKGLDFPLMPGQSMAGASALNWQLRMQAARVNPSLFQEAQQMMRGFAMGGFVGPFTETAASMQGYAGGGAVSTRSAGGGSSALSYHQIDLRTDAGTFRAGVSEDTMDNLRHSALHSKITETSPRPSWYS